MKKKASSAKATAAKPKSKKAARKAPPPPASSDSSAIPSAPEEEPAPPPPSKKELTTFCVAKFRENLATQLRLAERDEQHGPLGLGWLHNESKRAQVNAWAAFLREKLAELPSE